MDKQILYVVGLALLIFIYGYISGYINGKIDMCANSGGYLTANGTCADINIIDVINDCGIIKEVHPEYPKINITIIK